MTKTERVKIAEDGFLTINEACQFLRVSRPTVYGMMGRDELPFVMVGKVRRIPRRAIVALVSQGLQGCRA
jgi:excisionase family DNA binding protein